MGRKATGENKIAVTITMRPTIWSKFQFLCKDKKSMKASPRVEELVVRDIEEMSGQKVDQGASYKDLQQTLRKLTKDRDIVDRLLKDHEVADSLKDMCEAKYRLNTDTFKNGKEVIAALMRDLNAHSIENFQDNDIHLLIDLLEDCINICDTRAKLTLIRNKMYLNDEQPAVPETVEAPAEPQSEPEPVEAEAEAETPEAEEEQEEQEEEEQEPTVEEEQEPTVEEEQEPTVEEEQEPTVEEEQEPTVEEEQEPTVEEAVVEELAVTAEKSETETSLDLMAGKEGE